jgi:hypothetical protein
MPGVFALFEEAMFDHAAPVREIKDHEGIAHGAIGHRDRAPVLGTRLFQRRTMLAPT